MQNIFYYLFLQCLIHYQSIIVDTIPLEGSNIRDAGHVEFPFVVSIAKKGNKTAFKRHFCTGVLVSNQHVLTAAHCFVGILWGEIELLLGSANLTESIVYTPRSWITFNQWSVENKVKKRYKKNDIAMIMLSKKVKKSFVKPATIVYEDHDSWFDKKVEVAGWGYYAEDYGFPEILKTASLTVISNVRCARYVCSLTGRNILLKDRFFCSKAQPYTLGTCGDSGGPVIYEKTKVFAITKGNCPKNILPDLFEEIIAEFKVNLQVSLGYYKNFIEDVKKRYRI